MAILIPFTLFVFSTLSLLPSENNSNSNISSSSSSSLAAYATQQHTSSSVVNSNKASSLNSSLHSQTHHERKIYELVQVQIIHRHGDRTPITPMKDETYWSSTLPSPTLLSKIAKGTKIRREKSSSTSSDSSGNANGGGSNHAANGRGPFGKLTQLGLLQMVEVGSRLRDELLNLEQNNSEDDDYIDENGNKFLNKGRLFHKQSSLLTPSIISVKSTDFARTIQSVQALLIGLFPDHDNEDVIEIDARHTDILIPDPQPRRSQEQMQLEKTLSQRNHVLAKEAKLQNLARKISFELRPFIGDDANTVSFGIGEENSNEGDTTQQKERPLSFSQLSEILVCLNVRGLLPKSISMEEYDIVTSHSAWKWFENLRDGRLAYLAMKSFMNFIMENLESGQHMKQQSQHSKLHIFSAHDSSLIGLMCAFRLQQPSEWPEYGSYLKIELFKARPFFTTTSSSDGYEYFVRFSLNGNVLKSEWGLGEKEYPEAKQMIPLEHLRAAIQSEHGH